MLSTLSAPSVLVESAERRRAIRNNFSQAKSAVTPGARHNDLTLRSGRGPRLDRAG
jgi:hypothetical protein